MKDETLITPNAAFIATILFTLMLGVVDWSSGYELSFFVFYFIPIAVVGWMCSTSRAYFIALLSACIWFAADWFTAHPYSNQAYAIWNSMTRLVAFLVLAHAVSRIRLLLIQERELSRDLQKALTDVKTLTGLLPICANCKRIRNDQGYWQQLESYISKHTEAQFTHGICQECANKVLKEAGMPLMSFDQSEEGDVLTDSDHKARS